MKKLIKKKKIKKPKTPSITLLKRKLWNACSEFIRTRDKWMCFTCGRKGKGSGMHAGHFLPSAICNLELRYDPRNIRAQCFQCNIRLGGNGAIYYRYMIELFGQEYVDELVDQLEVKVKWTQKDYEAKTLFYKRALEMLSK